MSGLFVAADAGSSTLGAPIASTRRLPHTDSSHPVASEDSDYFNELDDECISKIPLDELNTNVKLPPPPLPGPSRTPRANSLGKRRRHDDTSELTPRAAKLLRELKPAYVSTFRFPPYIVAELPTLQNEIGRLPYGAQWEIARFISAGTTADVFSADVILGLRKMHTNMNAGPEIARVVARAKSAKLIEDSPFAAAFAKERAAKLPWAELDKEESILRFDPYGGLGCNERAEYLKHDPDWYGGRVQFTATLLLVTTVSGTNKGPDFKLCLDRPVLGPSHRFGRRFGSRRFIRVTIQEDIHLALLKSGHSDDDVINFFGRPVIIHSWVFRAYFAKEGYVYMYQTNERWDGTGIVLPDSNQSLSGGLGPRELTLYEFLLWHNPLSINSGQSIAKWAARFALGLSTSVPGIRLNVGSITEESDIVCNAFDGQGKVPNEMIMTDGCGFIHRKLLQQLEEKLGWELGTVATQMRIGGAKGLLIADPASMWEEEAPDVKLRPSQIKIRYPGNSEPPDPAKLIVDILRPARPSSHANLSTETIINFAENGVPLEVFVKLMKDGMEGLVDKVTTWESPSSLFDLWKEVQHAGSVIRMRLMREAGGSARAKGMGYSDDHSMSTNVDEEGLAKPDAALQEQSTAWWTDPISGCPSSLEETALVLLDSGFTPDSCPVLSAKLNEAAKRALRAFMKGFHISVPMSGKVFVIPDPCNVLQPGEVHFRSSVKNLIDPNGNKTDLILGDVLVTRHPCKVPTDAQKVKAVFHERLRFYTDVVIVSTKDHLFGDKLLHRHLASMTGGGDYDGDTMEVFWDPTIVSNFRNADPIFAREPPALQQSLSRTTETVTEFLARTSGLSSDEDFLFQHQKYLLGTLKDGSRIGIYSSWWESSIYKNGYFHDDTLFLAYMFTSILDGAKTGITVCPEVYQQHRKLYDIGPAPWNLDKWKSQSVRVLKRNSGLPPFVLDGLKKRLDAERGRLEKCIDSRLPKVKGNESPQWENDQDLAKPYADAVARAAEAKKRHGNDWAQKELDAIKAHVEQVYREHSTARRKTDSSSGRNKSSGGQKGAAPNKSSAPMTDLPIEQRQDMLRALSQKFALAPTVVDAEGEHQPLIYFDDASLRRVRASYAYVYDQKMSFGGWSHFPWDVALAALCEIKAAALGPCKVLTEDFYTRMTIAKQFLHKS